MREEKKTMSIMDKRNKMPRRRAGDIIIPRMDELTDEQWELVAPLVEVAAGKGRPREETRRVLNGVLYAIRNALTWANTPPEYPSYVTLFRRYHEWLGSGVLEQVIFALTGHLEQASGLDYRDALASKALHYEQNDGILTIHLPPEYSEYWMQPTAALLLMWMVNKALGVYTGVYRQACRERQAVRLNDMAGPRQVRPLEVVIVPQYISPAP